MAQLRLDSYYITLDISGDIPTGVYSQNFAGFEKDGIALTPHVRLGSSAKAELESRELATQWAEACMPILQRRYKNAEISYSISKTTQGDTARARKRINRDSAIVRARLTEQNFASNKPPSIDL